MDGVVVGPLSWSGTVAMIDLRLPTGREGGRRRGRGRLRWGGTARRGCASEGGGFGGRGGAPWRVRQARLVGRVSAGLVTLSGGIAR